MRSAPHLAPVATTLAQCPVTVSKSRKSGRNPESRARTPEGRAGAPKVWCPETSAVADEARWTRCLPKWCARCRTVAPEVPEEVAPEVPEEVAHEVPEEVAHEVPDERCGTRG